MKVYIGAGILMNVNTDDLSRKEQVYEKMTLWNNHRFVYTDGAKNKSNVSFAIYDSYLKLGVGFKLDEQASIFTGESVAHSKSSEWF